VNSFLACDGDWQINAGQVACTGTLQAVTQTEIAGFSSLTPEQVDALTQASLGLFASVFVLLIIRKVL
jgi:hypothetical protein